MAGSLAHWPTFLYHTLPTKAVVQRGSHAAGAPGSIRTVPPHSRTRLARSCAGGVEAVGMAPHREVAMRTKCRLSAKLLLNPQSGPPSGRQGRPRRCWSAGQLQRTLAPQGGPAVVRAALRQSLRQSAWHRIARSRFGPDAGSPPSCCTSIDVVNVSCSLKAG